MSNEALLRRLLGDEQVDRLLREKPEHPILSGDPRWIEELLTAREHLPLPEVPPVASQNLRDLFDRHLLQRRYEAVLVSDSRTTKQLEGVRGGRVPNEGWSLSYSCEAADIVLDVWPSGATVDLDIQVMTHGGESAAFQAALTGATDESASSDELGRVRLTDLAPANYELVLTNRRLHIVLHPDLRQGAS